MKPDRQMKVLLIVLTVGVWGLLARSLFPTSEAQAQKPREYMISLANEFGVTYPDQQVLLNDRAKKGWRLVAIWDNALYFER